MGQPGEYGFCPAGSKRALWSAEPRTGRDCGMPTPGPGTGLLKTTKPSSQEQ